MLQFEHGLLYKTCIHNSISFFRIVPNVLDKYLAPQYADGAQREFNIDGTLA
jgi:hypothetical protein